MGRIAGKAIATGTLTAAFLFLIALSPAARSDNEIKFGILLCLSGDCAEWGTNGLRGVELALDELNARGGVLGRTVKAVTQDSRDTVPSTTVSALRTLTNDADLHFIIGPTWTVGAMPIAPIVKQNRNIVVVSPSVGVKDFNESAENIVNTWPHDEKATRALARYAWSKGWKRAAIFGSQDPWVVTQSDTFDEEFRKLGGAITARVEPLPGSRELKAEAIRVKNSSPDVVFFSNYQTDVFSKELQKINCTLPKIVILMEKERVKSAEGALEGAVFAQYEKPLESFRKAFEKKYQAEPGITADTAYDAVMLFAKAIEESKSEDPAIVAQALRSIRNFEGASGKFSVDEKGGVDKKPVLWAVKGMDYVKVAE